MNSELMERVMNAMIVLEDSENCVAARVIQPEAHLLDIEIDPDAADDLALVRLEMVGGTVRLTAWREGEQVVSVDLLGPAAPMMAEE